MVNIFEYQNYREYLRDYYNSEKAAKKYFSYRYFSKKAGINAPAFLFYIIKNKRDLTKKSVLKISTAIGHNREEADFFENLVFFNQADTIQEKTVYYSKIIELRKPVLISEVGKDRYEYYNKWYHSVIREVVTFFDFKNDFALLGNFLISSITAREAQASVDLLEKLGFIEKDDTGLYHQSENLIAAKPDSVNMFIIEKFQREMLEMAMKSYDRFPRQERLTASTTFSISKETFELFKLKTREFRKELMEIGRLDSKPDRVYQFTFNLFPLTREKQDQ
jgi:uncharacterized protein (TIGR02147 family)